MFISFRGAIGSGKTTAAVHLINTRDFVRVSFADPLKVEVFNFLWSSEQAEVWERFYKETGFTDRLPQPALAFVGLYREELSDDQKIAWVNLHKAVLRPLLQWWGTEYRRAENENYWVEKAESYMRKLLTDGHSIVMDDCRFDNEMELVASLGGKQVFIECPKAEALAIERSGGGAVGIQGHESEKLLDKDDPRNDAIIVNDAELDDFLYDINAVIARFGNQ